MKKITSIHSLKKEIENHKKHGLRVGFVPTMGALHNGHLSLIRQARKDTDIVVVSVFVNPLQFGPQEDLAKYPRNIKRDKALAEKAGADIFFAPSENEMYLPDFDTFIDMFRFTNKLCGKSRPDHFRGVMTVVTKLFNIVQS
jgi:pantoate--beta-alanine ligase